MPPTGLGSTCLLLGVFLPHAMGAVSDSERAALVEFAQSTGYQNWTNNNGWGAVRRLVLWFSSTLCQLLSPLNQAARLSRSSPVSSVTCFIFRVYLCHRCRKDIFMMSLLAYVLDVWRTRNLTEAVLHADAVHIEKPMAVGSLFHGKIEDPHTNFLLSLDLSLLSSLFFFPFHSRSSHSPMLCLPFERSFVRFFLYVFFSRPLSHFSIIPL